MSNYEEIKQALAEGNFKQAMLIAFSNNLKLKFKTTVKQQDIQPKIIETSFNLIQGVETRIESEILDSNYQHITDFHRQQLHSAYETWEKNRETLIKIFQLLSGNPVNFGETENKLEADTEVNFVNEIPLAVEQNVNDEFENFDAELVTKAVREEEITHDNDSVEEEEEFEYEITNQQESSAIFEEERGVNWVDEINDSEEVTESLVSDEFDVNSEFDDLPIGETNIEEKEEIIEEEVEIEETQTEENWDDLDWGDEAEETEKTEETEETEETQETEEIIEKPINQESSPSLEVDDDWQEWLDEDDLPTNKEGYDVEKIDWNQEDWQDAKN